MLKPKSRRERIAFTVQHGLPILADSYAAFVWRKRGYYDGTFLLADVVQGRSPGFHRLAHRLGTLVAQNIDGFDGMDAHAVLKRLQWESGVGCEEMGVKVNGLWMQVRIPLSLAFDSMDEKEFRSIIRGLSRHIAENYWKDMTPEQIEDMSEAMPTEVL